MVFEDGGMLVLTGFWGGFTSVLLPPQRTSPVFAGSEDLSPRSGIDHSCTFCPSAPTFSFASPKEKVAKRKGDFLPNCSAGKKMALRCYPSALFSGMALVVLPIVYQRFGFLPGRSSILLFAARQPHLRHNKGAIICWAFELLSS